MESIGQTAIAIVQQEDMNAEHDCERSLVTGAGQGEIWVEHVDMQARPQPQCLFTVPPGASEVVLASGSACSSSLVFCREGEPDNELLGQAELVGEKQEEAYAVDKLVLSLASSCQEETPAELADLQAQPPPSQVDFAGRSAGSSDEVIHGVEHQHLERIGEAIIASMRRNNAHAADSCVLSQVPASSSSQQETLAAHTDSQQHKVHSMMPDSHKVKDQQMPARGCASFSSKVVDTLCTGLVSQRVSAFTKLSSCKSQSASSFTAAPCRGMAAECVRDGCVSQRVSAFAKLSSRTPQGFSRPTDVPDRGMVLQRGRAQQRFSDGAAPGGAGRESSSIVDEVIIQSELRGEFYVFGTHADIPDHGFVSQRICAHNGATSGGESGSVIDRKIGSCPVDLPLEHVDVRSTQACPYVLGSDCR
jgi:hypothetical protein